MGAFALESLSFFVCEREKPFEERLFPSRALLFPNLFEWPRARRFSGEKKDLFLDCPLLQRGKGREKKSRRRTTLPHSNVQYHRREASYRSCSGWEREFQAKDGDIRRTG